MPEPHYGHETKARTLPIFERLLDELAPKEGQDAGPWTDLDAWALKHGAKAGTVKSKFRECSDVNHAHLGLLTEARTIPGKRGAWEYRLVRSKPGQLPLFEGQPNHA